MKITRMVRGHLETRDAPIEPPEGPDRIALEDWLHEHGVGPALVKLHGPAGFIELRAPGRGDQALALAAVVDRAVVLRLGDELFTVFCGDEAEQLAALARFAPALALSLEGGSHA